MTRIAKALIVGNFLSAIRGTHGICELLAEKLSQHGWQVTTTSSHDNRLVRILDMLKVTWQSRKAYDVASIDVFSGPSFLWAEAVSRLLRRLNKPFVLILRGGNLPEFSRKRHRRVKMLLQSASFVTTPSHYVASELSWARSDISVLPNAIDVEKYPFHCRKSPNPRFAWLRAFHSIYNPTIAAETVALLVEDFPEIQLTMFGPDKKDGSLQTLIDHIRETSISSHISIVGAIPKSEVPNRLAQHDIFLNTTTAESFGVAVMEAAALGMCIVTTNVGELPYIWAHEHDALLVPSSDPQAMADAVRRILTEPELAERLSRNARAKAEQFDWSNILPQWESLLTDVIKRHQHG